MLPDRLLEFERRQRVVIQDFSTWIVSKEDLIISKLFRAKDSHSEMQPRDVKKLADTGRETACVEHWTESLGLRSLWEECHP